MTQYEKDILLKDLCARLPYGVVVGEKCTEQDKTFLPNKEDNRLVSIDAHANALEVSCGSWHYLDEVKPYLFPLSSMTEEQMDELLRLRNQQYFVLREYTGTYKDSIPHCIGECNVINWLNKNHFDYRGLIEEGLAIDATGFNIY